MRQALHRLDLSTERRGLLEITPQVSRWVGEQKISAGLLTLFCPHTSASLLIQENADPKVRADLEAFFETIAPEAPGRYRHGAEGADDMPADRADADSAGHTRGVRPPGPRNLAGPLSVRTPARASSA
jgi:secondary thiamine-phosphate synthase enzyme